MLRGVLIALGSIMGVILGAIVGILIPLGLVILARWDNPNDPSAGSLGILVIATVPAGILVGFFFGALAVDKFLKKG